MKYKILLLLGLLHVVSVRLSGQSSECITLTFDQPGVLPSAEGFVFQGSAAESDVFIVNAGKLYLNTIGTSAAAFYLLPNAYDSSRDFTLEFEARVIQVTGPFGFDFEVSDASLDFEFGVMENGVFLPPPGRPFFPLGTVAGATHVYRISSIAGSSTYELFLDNVLAVAGNIAPGGDPGMRFLFGDGTGSADSHVEIDNIRFCQPQSPPVLTVLIDIKPGSFPNTIQLRSHGQLPVAILGTSSFAVSAVDPTTVTFAGAPVSSHTNGSLFAAYDDVNNDGIIDLLLHFSIENVQLSSGDTTAILFGQLHDSTSITGQDSVRVLP